MRSKLNFTRYKAHFVAKVSPIIGKNEVVPVAQCKWIALDFPIFKFNSLAYLISGLGKGSNTLVPEAIYRGSEERSESPLVESVRNLTSMLSQVQKLNQGRVVSENAKRSASAHSASACEQAPLFWLRTQALLSGFSSAISRANTALIARRTSRTPIKRDNMVFWEYSASNFSREPQLHI